MQNSKASKMFDSQPLGCAICSNHLGYNIIILIFKGDVLINFDPHPPVPIVMIPPRVGTSLMDATQGALQIRNPSSHMSAFTSLATGVDSR